MELVKDIYFNTDKLVENTNVKVSYTGKFYQGNNEKVFLHYGYGKDWNNLNEIEMKKTDLGYQAELNLITGGETLNFCFKNQNNEWDNNLGNNYVFDIEKKPELIAKELKGTNLVFWGKNFGNKEESQTSSNIFWTSENNKIDNEISNSVDVVFSKKADDTSSKLDSRLEKCEDENCFKIITPSVDTTVANIEDNIVNSTSENIDSEPISEIVEPLQQETSIALTPTGFNYWTKRIKDTVCKFFAYVPKLISGNYKRNLANDKK